MLHNRPGLAEGRSRKKSKLLRSFHPVQIFITFRALARGTVETTPIYVHSINVDLCVRIMEIWRELSLHFARDLYTSEVCAGGRVMFCRPFSLILFPWVPLYNVILSDKKKKNNNNSFFPLSKQNPG